MSSPPTSFVPADDTLFPPLAHDGAWLALGVVAGLLGLALLVWTMHAATDGRSGAGAAEMTVRGRYLAEIDELQRRFEGGLLDERQLHHELSTTVRRFAADHGASGALAMTPAELEALGLVGVGGVLTGYQPPQFMREPICDPAQSVAAARRLIESTEGPW